MIVTTAPDDGLVPEQKEYLRKFFQAYLDGVTPAARRAVAIKAGVELARECTITSKDECSKLRKSVIAYLYDRLIRDDSHIKPERYGFLKKVTGRTLWARSRWEDLKPLIQAYKDTKNKHSLTAYNAITKEGWKNLAKVERDVWIEEAKVMNEGRGSEESKALYGDLVYTEFINNILVSAQRWFGSHMIIISSRPSIALDTQHANSIKETRPLHTWQSTFLQQFRNPFIWNVKEYPPWTAQMNDREAQNLSLITFDSQGEPLMPPLNKYPYAKDRAKVLTKFWAIHCCMSRCHPSCAPPYIDFPNTGHLYLEDIFFPPEALAGEKALYLRKPGQLGAERLHHWFVHILALQERYLSGEPGVLPFRWKGIKVDEHTVADANYTRSWMIAFAQGIHPTARETSDSPAATIPASTSTPADTPMEPATGTSRPSRPVRKSTKGRKPSEANEESEAETEETTEDEDFEQVDLMMAGQDEDDDEEEEEDDFYTSARKQLLSEDGDDPAEDDDGEAREQAVMNKGKGVAGRTTQLYSNPRLTPAAEPVIDVLDDLETMLNELEDNPPIPPLTGPPPFSPPNWISTDGTKKAAFLRSLSTDSNYLALVDFYVKQNDSVTLTSAAFPWVDWNSSRIHLPVEYHRENGKLTAMLQYMNEWKKSPQAVFRSSGKLEEHLLFIGLLHRDIHAAHFNFDAEATSVQKPPYFEQTILTMRVFDIIGACLKKIAENIPLEQDTVAPSQPGIVEASAASALQSISTAPAPPPYPVPRMKQRSTVPKGKQGPALLRREPSPLPHTPPPRTSSPVAESSKMPTNKRTKKKDDLVQELEEPTNIRRSGREHNPPKRFLDGETAVTQPARGRGRGKGGRGGRGGR
ncbi:hypothetical protein QCA50_003926 [Cerrena zonata]|uniref:Uncharacterized protein n=1 Tax=Cerrena zonata TaxID=2478898 RepID=A0AAW0GFW4_9APHY